MGTGNGPNNGKLCVSNYCNHLNDGHCDLEKSGGNCVWWTQADIRTINQYGRANKPGWTDLRGHGCYRNPCNLPGHGQASESCEEQGNGVLECTWCYGRNDDLLRGKGMGCQAT